MSKNPYIISDSNTPGDVTKKVDLNDTQTTLNSGEESLKNYSNFWMRLLALIIDGVVTFLVSLVFSSVVSDTWYAGVILSTILGLFYYPV